VHRIDEAFEAIVRELARMIAPGAVAVRVGPVDGMPAWREAVFVPRPGGGPHVLARAVFAPGPYGYAVVETDGGRRVLTDVPYGRLPETTVWLQLPENATADPTR